MIGIYKITNPKGRIYIGQSLDLKQRFNSYKKLRCKNQPKIYNSLLKYGVEKHIFEIIVECDEKELNRLERYYQEIYNCLENGLNCKLTEDEYKSSRYSNESKKKMSNSAKIKVFSESHRKSLSISRTGKGNAMYGKVMTNETKAKIGLANKNKGIETRIKQSISAKKRPKSFYDNLSKKNKGKLPPNAKIVLNLETGIYYNSITEASKTLSKGFGAGTLIDKLAGKRKNNTNFIIA